MHAGPGRLRGQEGPHPIRVRHRSSDDRSRLRGRRREAVDGGTSVWPTTNFEKKKTPFKFGGDGIVKWFRIKPLAKNKPLFQVVRISGDSVQRKVLTRKKFTRSADGLSLKKPAAVSGERAILIFSGITPIATDPFGYSYQLQ